jgi:hypothetical protein
MVEQPDHIATSGGLTTMVEQSILIKHVLTINVLSCTFLAGLPCEAGEPIDPDRLTQMRRELDLYYSCIKVLRVRGESTWERSDSPWAKATREAMDRAVQLRIEEILNRPGGGDPERRFQMERLAEQRAKRDKAKHVTNVMMLDAFPSLRLENTDIWTHPDGTTEADMMTKIAHDGRYTQVRPAHRHVAVESSPGYDKFFTRMPSTVLGLRMLRTTGTPTSTLLGSPTVTTIEGKEVVAGLEALVVKVGPHIPPDRRPEWISDDGWVKLWLAPSVHHLPVRADYHFVVRRPDPVGAGSSLDEHVQSIELAEFQPAKDQATGGEIPFPRRMTWTDRGGVTRWRISEVSINVPTTPIDFSPDIPADYNVVRDGVPPIRVIVPTPR